MYIETKIQQKYTTHGILHINFVVYSKCIFTLYIGIVCKTDLEQKVNTLKRDQNITLRLDIEKKGIASHL